MKNSLAKIAIAAALTLCLAAMAQAHRVNIFAALDGNMIVGRVYFSGGGMAENIDVDVLDMDGMKITTVKTNAKGEFLFAPKIKDTQYSFSVDTGDGHAAKTTVAIGSPALVGTGALRPPSLDQLRRSGAATSLKPPASQGQSHVAAPVEVSMDPALVDAISRQIAELKLQIDASQSRLRLCDILGGLGYIAGIFGLLAFLQARRMKVANEPSAKKPEGEKGKGEAGDASK